MSEADRILKELGYEKYSEDEDKIIYKYDRETFRVSLTFNNMTDIQKQGLETNKKFRNLFGMELGDLI